MSLGTCDFCEEENRILKACYDKWDEHILSKCKFGCEDPRSISQSLPSEDFQVISLTLLDSTPHYDSTWIITYSDATGTEGEIKIVRRDDSEETVRKNIFLCRNVEELKALDLKNRIIHD